MRHKTILALLGALLLAGCAGTSGGSPSEFAVRAGRFLDVAVPAVDEFVAAEHAKPEPDADTLRNLTTARAALDGLRSVATAGGSIDTLRDLAPAFREVLLARGDSPDEAAGKVTIFLLTLAALDAALAPV